MKSINGQKQEDLWRPTTIMVLDIKMKISLFFSLSPMVLFFLFTKWNLALYSGQSSFDDIIYVCNISNLYATSPIKLVTPIMSCLIKTLTRLFIGHSLQGFYRMLQCCQPCSDTFTAGACTTAPNDSNRSHVFSQKEGLNPQIPINPRLQGRRRSRSNASCDEPMVFQHRPRIEGTSLDVDRNIFELTLRLLHDPVDDLFAFAENTDLVELHNPVIHWSKVPVRMVLNGAAEIESEGKISILTGIFEEHPRLFSWKVERIDAEKLSDECVNSVTVVG
jgi:hypothetical protein